MKLNSIVVTTLSSFIFIVISGCASQAKDIPSTYVSPLVYNNYDCEQIGSEMARLTRKVSEAAGAVEERASDDSGTMAIGLILFWPSLFFLDGDGVEAQEYGRLKGEYDALEVASIEKKCGNEFKTLEIPQKEVKEIPEAPL